MKNLLIATDNFLPRWDGISRFLLETIPTLTENFKVTVLAPDFGEKPRIGKIRLIRFPTYNFQLGDIKPAKPDINIIKGEIEKADIIWTQGVGPISALTIIFGKKAEKKVVAFIHSLEWELFSKSVRFFKKTINAVTKLYVKYLYNKCDLLLVPSLEVKEIMKWMGVRTKKKVIHLGIDVEKFKPAEDKAKIKEKLGLSEMTVIGFSGRIAREKDLMTLYRAFLRLEKEYKDVLLLIIGEGIGELKKFFEKKLNIKIIGAVNNVVPYLQAMDIFVLPSLTETSSLATMEAMACGLPVITTKVGFVKKYVKDRQNGLFFPKKNDLVLSLKMKWLLENEAAMMIIAANARKTIVNKYRLEDTLKNIRTTLTSI